MRQMIRAIAVCLLTALAAVTAHAEKLPSAYDNRRDGYVFDGKQLFPFQLYGVAIEWDRDCSKGKADQCLKLAHAFENGLGDLEPNSRVVTGYYLLACEKGAGEGCAKSASALREGSNGYVNAELAQKMADRGCNVLKYQASCSSLAAGLAKSGGAGQAQAAALVDTACGAGDDEGCRIKANALFYTKGDAASRAAALKMYEPACKAKRAWGCLGLTDAYYQGLGVARDPAKAGEYAKIGCLDASGDKLRLCTLYASRVVRTAGKAEMNKAEQLLNSSCAARDGLACYEIASFGFERRSGATTTTGEATYYARRGCDLDFARACALLGTIYAGGYDLAADPAIELALQDKACRLGEQKACDRSRSLLAQNASLRFSIPAIDPSLSVAEQLRRAKAAVDAGDRNRAVMTVVRLMQEDNEDAEWLLGGWLYYGLPGAFGPERKNDGLVLFENAARVGHVDAAVFMGMAYWYGQDVPEDHTKGLNYMGIAAARGSQMAKAIYRSMQAEPIRQENARRAQEMAEWAAKRKADWSSSWANWTPSWSAPSSPYNPVSSGPSVSQIYDNANFNQMIDHYKYGSTCPASNHYC